jgi:hypothetical protein
MRSVVLVVALLAVLSMASVDPHDTEFNALVPMKHKKKKKHEAPADPDSLDPYKWPDLVVMHIPKTAVDSLCQEFIRGGMWKNYSGTILCHGEALREHTRASPVQENCYKELPPGNKLAMFREPRQHVLSQYAECRFNAYFSTTQTPGLPGTACSDHNQYNETCLAQWLDFASRYVSEDQHGLSCYHPYNMQARYLVCDKKGHLLHTAAERTPSLATAAATLNKIDIVGITDLYDETWCYVQYMIHEALPSVCSCGSMGKKKEVNHAESMYHPGEVHVTHGVHHLRAEVLSPETLAKLDAATTVDQVIYARAASRFLGKLCTLQLATGHALICPSRMDELKASGGHIRGFSAAVDSAIRGCDGMD